MSHEVIKRCGSVGVTEALISVAAELYLTEEALRELNMRLLLVQLRDNPRADVQCAFAQAATADLRPVGISRSAGAGK
jgi:hypothetical protein